MNLTVYLEGFETEYYWTQLLSAKFIYNGGFENKVIKLELGHEKITITLVDKQSDADLIILLYNPNDYKSWEKIINISKHIDNPMSHVALAAWYKLNTICKFVDLRCLDYPHFNMIWVEDGWNPIFNSLEIKYENLHLLR